MRALLWALLLAIPGWHSRPKAELCAICLGERFTYGLRVARMGARGHAEMWVDGPEVVRGMQTYVLHFDSQAGIGPFRASDRTSSWVDPQRMAAMRFEKVEHHLFENHRDEVEIYPTQRRWSAADGSSGETSTDSPLDELSFIYFVRSLPLLDDSVYVMDRHFDTRRNPTTVRMVKHEHVETRAGVFKTLRVEMRVKDPRHYKGEGLLIINLSDDARRVPVRIESTVPFYGKTVLTLETLSAPPE